MYICHVSVRETAISHNETATKYPEDCEDDESARKARRIINVELLAREIPYPRDD